MIISHRYVEAERKTLKRLNKIEAQYRSEKERLRQVDGKNKDAYSYTINM